MTVNLEIAGFRVRVVFDAAFGSFPVPASWTPFAAPSGAAPDFTMRVLPRRPDEAVAATRGMYEVSSSFNDLGLARLFSDGSRYVAAVAPLPDGGLNYMEMSADFSGATLRLAPGYRYSAFVLDSMTRIWFSQAIVTRRAFLLHASAVEAAGRAYVFMGRSGTGKSTHTSLWLSTFPDARLLNDDNPAVRVLDDGTVRVYGTPWSGKTPCYRQASAPAAGFVRLMQAPADSYRALEGIEAFVAILPGVSVISHSRELYGKACDTVGQVSAAVATGTLACLPAPSAARLARASLP